MIYIILKTEDLMWHRIIFNSELFEKSVYTKLKNYSEYWVDIEQVFNGLLHALLRFIVNNDGEDDEDDDDWW